MNSLYAQYRLRIKIMACGIFVFGAIMLSKLFMIQIINGEKWSQEAENETLVLITKTGQRGTIFDRNGLELAQTIKKYDFWVNTNKNVEKEKIVNLFSNALNQPKSIYLNKLSQNKEYVSLARNIPETQGKSILNKVPYIKGLHKDASFQRYYPFGTLAAQVLGYVDQNKIGQFGIEGQFDDILKGTTGKVVHNRSASGRLHKSLTAIQPNIKDGFDIHLTIDIELQSILQSELQKGLEKTNAKSANGIIMDPYTGEILAMATIPDFDPNIFSDYNIENFKNRTISDSYEPGSTFKIVNISTALTNSIVTPIDTIYCENGEYKLSNGKIIHDHEPHGDLSVADIFAYSSNIGIMKIAEMLGDDAIYKASRNFGFGMPSGIQLPGESGGKLRTLNKWSGISGREVSIGQEIAATSLQLTTAFSAIANGGYLIKPNIIDKVGGETSKGTFPKVLRQVMSESVSQELKSMLEKVVVTGTGDKAYIPGFRVGGKTGTAEKFINGKYSKHEFISSFAGIFPIDAPRYVCVVSIDAPQYGFHWGNETAAPIVKGVFSRIISDKEGLEPYFKYIEEELSPIDKLITKAEADTSLPFLSTRYLITKNVKEQVPNFRGKTLKQVIREAKKLGIDIDPIGTRGRVVWQSPNPGSDLKANKKCKIKLEVNS